MPQLYLIRRNLESFLGPLTATELETAYRKMAFGLQDEIAGNCGPWVSLHDFEATRRHYPDILRIIQEDLRSDWETGDGDDLTRPRSKGKNKSKWDSLQLTIASGFLLIAVGAALSAFYFTKLNKNQNKNLSDESNGNSSPVSAAPANASASPSSGTGNSNQDSLPKPTPGTK